MAVVTISVFFLCEDGFVVQTSSRVFVMFLDSFLQ